MGNLTRRDFARTHKAGADERTVTGEKRAPQGSQGPRSYEPVQTHECDVLVIGGGIAGMEAALRAVSLGKTAIIVDKGVFGHSGASGINWGHTYQSMEFSEDDDETVAKTVAVMDMVCEGLLNQPYFFNILKAQKEEKCIATALKYGSIPLYNEDGTVYSHNQPHPDFPVTHDQGFWPRMMAQWCQRNGNVTEIFDNTYVVDILLSEDGHAAGAVAIDTIHGTPRVFRSKTTVMATGSYCWITGWNGMGAESMAGKECTGDGIALLLKHGVPMADMEQFCGDASQWTPMGVRQTMGNLNFDALQTPRNMIFDADMVSWEEMLKDVQVPFLSMGSTMKLMYGMRLHGRTTPNGGCLMDKDCAPVMPRYYRRCEQRQKAVMGYQMPQLIEVVPQTWDSAGCPRDLSPNSMTIIPGMFFAGAAPGAVGGMAQVAAQTGGWLAANGAAKIADEIALPKVAAEQIKGILDKAYEVLDREPQAPIRPRHVMKKIQQTYWDREHGPLKDEAKILAIIEELNRIKAEELPRMYIADKSYRMNCEWRDAFEAESMLYCALGASYAALLRKETRGMNLRTDYPDTDNSIGLFNTVVAVRPDGQWTYEKGKKFDSIVPAEMIAAMVPENIGLNTVAKKK